MSNSSTHTVPSSNSVPFRLTESEVAKDPGKYYEDLLSKCPVAHSDSFDGGFWMLSRYKDVYDAAINVGVFSSAGPVTIPALPPPRIICIEQDDPEHRKYRKPLQGWFSVRRMAALEPSIRSVVTALIDEIVEQGEGDLAEAVANNFPTIAIALMLGLPEEDWPWFRERAMSRTRLAQEGDTEGSAAAHVDIATRLSESIKARRAEPRDDMLSDIALLNVDGKPIDHDDAVSLAFLLLGAGIETTASGIGGLLYRVAGEPELRDQLIADPALIEAAVEESLRIESPFPGLARTATADNEVSWGDLDVVDLVVGGRCASRSREW